MGSVFTQVKGWLWENWTEISSYIVTAIVIFLAVAPSFVAKRERDWRWVIGVIALVLILSYTGNKANKESIANLKAQTKDLFVQSKFSTKDDIAKLTEQIETGFKEVVEAIRSAPKAAHPLKAPIPEEAAPLPAPPHISFTQVRGVSTDPAFPYAIQVTIQSDQQVSVAFAVDCTGPVGNVKAFLVGQGAYIGVQLGYGGNAAIVRFGYPQLTPQAPLVVTIFSKEDIRATGIRAL